MHIALYKPDIPQNTAAIIRLAACLNLKIHIIEPCGFNLHDPRFKRVVMDYLGFSKIFRYDSYDNFLNKIKRKKVLKNFKIEFDRLWIHGLVHLLGHDHKKYKDFLIMNQIEKNYFSLINV